MQSQSSMSDKIVVASAPVGGHTGGELTQVGDLLGVPYADAAQGERSTVLVRGVHGTTKVLEDEVWTVGQPLYWYELAEVVTGMATEWPIGWAAEAKAANTAYGVVALDRPMRQAGLIVAPFDFDLMASSLFAVGTHVLRVLPSARLITKTEYFKYTNPGSAGSATIALGNGSGTNVIAATAFNDADFTGVYQDFTNTDGGTPAEPDVSIAQVALIIATAALNAGKFVFRAEYAPA
jgi:predicted RecA/RadA family phage recombinase